VTSCVLSNDSYHSEGSEDYAESFSEYFNPSLYVNLNLQHPEMSAEELLRFTDPWKDQWRGMNTSWWSEISRYAAHEQVFVLLFGVGSGNEGVYSLQRWTEDGLPHDTVLAFASKQDAERYASLLELEMDRVAAVESISPANLVEFCRDSEFDLRVVDNRAVVLGLFLPPNQSTEVTDWERASRLRSGVWSVLEDVGRTNYGESSWAYSDTLEGTRNTFDEVSEIFNSDYNTKQDRDFLEKMFRKE